KSKPLFHTVERSFIAEPLPEADKILKIPSNPAFTGDFANANAGGGDKGKQEENFSVSKVWIDPGCIVCDACEGIYPEVFDVQEETCVIRPDAPLDNGLLIQEAADACPVEVIKFKKA
ncbi:MAG: ferredoxin, partial [Bacteriovoracaceae bacterium]